MSVSWLGVVLRLILLLVVVPTVLVVGIATSILSGLLGGGRCSRPSTFGFFENWLDPTRHLTGTIPGLSSGGFSGQLFDMLMRSLNSGGRPW